MLVLSRQRDETIMIGDDIEVTVVDIRGDKVRLGINAPREISVHRKEVYDAIRRENRAAAQVKPEDVSGAAKAPPLPEDNSRDQQKVPQHSEIKALKGQVIHAIEKNRFDEAKMHLEQLLKLAA